MSVWILRCKRHRADIVQVLGEASKPGHRVPSGGTRQAQSARAFDDNERQIEPVKILAVLRVQVVLASDQPELIIDI